MILSDTIVRDKKMAAQKEQKPLTPPYVPYRTFNNSLNKLQERGVPGRIDASVFTGQSGSGIAALLAAYKYLGLMTESGAPTDTLKQLVAATESDRAPLIKELLESRYEFLQQPNIDLSDATTQQIEQAFRDQGIGGSTITKAVSFFLTAATAAGLEVSKHIKTPPPKRNGAPRAKRSAKSKSAAGADASPVVHAHTSHKQSAAQLLLAKFPDFDPSWPEEIKTKWFESFSSLRGAMLKEEGS